jgi:hypothetical protein
MGLTTRIADSGTPMLGYFCKACGNRMAHVQKLKNGKTPTVIAVCATKLENFEWTWLEDKDLVVHCWTKYKSPGVVVPDGVLVFEGQTPGAGNEWMWLRRRASKDGEGREGFGGISTVFIWGFIHFFLPFCLDSSGVFFYIFDHFIDHPDMPLESFL